MECLNAHVSTHAWGVIMCSTCPGRAEGALNGSSEHSRYIGSRGIIRDREGFGVFPLYAKLRVGRTAGKIARVRSTTGRTPSEDLFCPNVLTLLTRHQMSPHHSRLVLISQLVKRVIATRRSGCRTAGREAVSSKPGTRRSSVTGETRKVRRGRPRGAYGRSIRPGGNVGWRRSAGVLCAQEAWAGRGR